VGKGAYRIARTEITRMASKEMCDVIEKEILRRMNEKKENAEIS